MVNYGCLNLIQQLVETNTQTDDRGSMCWTTSLVVLLISVCVCVCVCVCCILFFPILQESKSPNLKTNVHSFLLVEHHGAQPLDINFDYQL